MKIIVLLLLLLLIAGCAKKQIEIGVEEMANTFDLDGIKIEWLGHAGFKIKTDKVVYIDPFQLQSAEPADIILISHGHYDHCSVADIRKVSNPNTLIFTTPDCSSKLTDIDVKNITLVKPGDKLNVNGIKLELVPAYNIGKQFHPKENGWVGFILEINGKRIYHAGDTDATPEMEALQNIDVAMVPVGGTYTMTAEEAANAVNAFKPRIAIPMHYGSIVGTAEDAGKFKELCKCQVEIL